MTDYANSKPEELPWPQAGDQLFVSAEDAENNAWLKWRGEAKWWAYAEGYRKAADVLVEGSTETLSDQDFLVYPISFLYRHYLELRLKGLIMVGSQLVRIDQGFPPCHDIQKLWKEARTILEQVWPSGPKADLDNVETSIREFAAIDPQSYAFRYPSTKDGKEHLPTLTHINLRNLSEVMGRLAGLLDSALDGMLQMLRMRREAKEDYLGY